MNPRNTAPREKALHRGELTLSCHLCEVPEQINLIRGENPVRIVVASPRVGLATGREGRGNSAGGDTVLLRIAVFYITSVCIFENGEYTINIYTHF